MANAAAVRPSTAARTVSQVSEALPRVSDFQIAGAAHPASQNDVQPASAESDLAARLASLDVTARRASARRRC